MSETSGEGEQGAESVCSSKVAILLCTMQGQPHLREQLDSIIGQTHSSWSIWVSDDGPTDGTHDILAEYVKSRGASKLNVKSGPAHGCIKNFMSLVCNPKTSAECYAFSDQDDKRRFIDWNE